MNTVIDPVCGMKIDPATAAGTSVWNGETFHFCAKSCQTKFEVSPQDYVAVAVAATAAPSCCTTGHSCC